MGCQASRLEQDEEGQPARPGLLRRFEDITKREEVESRDKKEEKEEERDKGRVDDWDDSGDQDDEGWLSDREDHLFYPRSPSFREYCINCYSRELDKDDGEIFGLKSHVKGAKRERRKSQRKEGAAFPFRMSSQYLSPLLSGIKTKITQERIKTKEFQEGVKKDGSIKNLWNVSAWYNPVFHLLKTGPERGCKSLLMTEDILHFIKFSLTHFLNLLQILCQLPVLDEMIL
ncbi:hypothetical protein CK203_067592 [Vitis vinifera]|uniref:Uncharacterized protein n=1 Tax=Vitis vinifera TaxID=29760 RepID=A0A438EBM5_VITVI|nr:hypothetical protein CK203_067592 [Vitis vinifera]